MSILYRGPSIDASYHVTVHLTGVSEKIKMWKVNGQQMPSDGKSSPCQKSIEKNTFGETLGFFKSTVYIFWHEVKWMSEWLFFNAN